MPRFYFHAEDGRCFPDEEGTLLPDTRAARRQATAVFGELVKEMPDGVWDSGAFRVTVKDEDGLVLFVLDMSAVTSPAAAAPRGRF